MPESAEVKLTTEYLNSRLENQIVTGWTFVGGQYEDKYPDGFRDFESSLPLLVEQVNCKGKLIYFVLYNEFRTFYVLHSLRMTGRWQDQEDDYCRWYIEFGNNDIIWFRNPRCLATLQFTTNETIFRGMLNKLGPDILTPEFNLEIWRKLLEKHRKKNVTSFMMDQTIISGCGNYIKAEALYYAGISPLRKVGSLREEETEKLFEALRLIPRFAYNSKGLSLRDYTDPKGKKGYYEDKLRIYGKRKAKRTKTADGRTTYWDPEKQK